MHKMSVPLTLVRCIFIFFQVDFNMRQTHRLLLFNLKWVERFMVFKRFKSEFIISCSPWISRDSLDKINDRH